MFVPYTKESWIDRFAELTNNNEFADGTGTLDAVAVEQRCVSVAYAANGPGCCRMASPILNLGATLHGVRVETGALRQVPIEHETKIFRVAKPFDLCGQGCTKRR